MTDNEIINALEICLNETDICNGCPYEFDDCLNEDGTSRLMQATFDLVNRQKAEIERLSIENIGLKYDLQVASEESLCVRENAIKEFWNKIKKYCKREICFFTPQDERELIKYGNKIVKEMV